ncbi:unnamed protein product [Ilex paraguariensis]|uniref:Uncharacterized protein n=1 Tax=Ilex paraguariensis TaxID=185542 RepID=A0ABC8RWY1_9AQUA
MLEERKADSFIYIITTSVAVRIFRGYKFISPGSGIYGEQHNIVIVINGHCVLAATRHTGCFFQLSSSSSSSCRNLVADSWSHHCSSEGLVQLSSSACRWHPKILYRFGLVLALLKGGCRSHCPVQLVLVVVISQRVQNFQTRRVDANCC